MNPDLPQNDALVDWLDQALQSRSAMTAPVTFSTTVLERLRTQATVEPANAPAWIEELGRAGLVLAVLGGVYTVDMNRLAVWIDRGLATPAPLITAALVLCISGVWFSWRTEVLD